MMLMARSRKGWHEELPTGKNYSSERARLGMVTSFIPPQCKGEAPPGVRASVVALVPAPGSEKSDRVMKKVTKHDHLSPPTQSLV